MLLLVLLCAAQFMLILDITVVNVALPTIQADLGIPVDDLPWVVTAYTLPFGGLLLLGGRVADLLGRRSVFLAGLAVFTAASLVAALAGGTGTLIAARALQGIGAALLSPAALSLVTTAFPEGPLRHRALAVWAAIAAGGGAVGVLAGGFLTGTFGWEAIFLVNVPVGAAVAVAALWIVPGARPVTGRRIDLAGALLATGSLLALTYGLAEAGTAGWGAPRVLGLFALAGAGLAGFVAVERRVPDPLVPLRVLARRPVATALGLMILGMGPVFAGFYFSSLYLQQVLGHSAVRTGLEFLPVAVAIVAAAHAAGRLVTRFGAKPVSIAGLAAAAAGVLLLGGVPPAGSYPTDILPGFLLLGAGGGLAAAGVMVTAMSGAGEADAGLRSGLTNTAHELGIALVLPLLSTVAASRLGAGALTAPATDPSQLTAGIADAYRAAAAVALAGAVLALVALRRADAAAGTPAVHIH